MYTVKLLQSVHQERSSIPVGEIHQEIKRIVTALAEDPRPSYSTEVQFKKIEALNWQPRKIRVESWRILYAVDDRANQAVVLAIKQGVLEEKNKCSYLLGNWEYHYC
ncbi:MAG: plasmid stabilization system [Cyanobacteriota bacterium]|nr:plasmid stabilization system [Cyanobacteriota bacterium]